MLFKVYTPALYIHNKTTNLQGVTGVYVLEDDSDEEDEEESNP